MCPKSPPPSMADLQKSRANQGVSDEQVALYRAAKGFLVVEWVGAVLLVSSFTWLYAFGLRPGASVRSAVAVSLVLLVLGVVLWISGRNAYYRIDFLWRRKTEFFATVVASTGIVFWALFALAAFLVWRGVEFL